MSRTFHDDQQQPTLSQLLCSAQPVKEVAQLAGINPRTCWRAIRRGTLRAFGRPGFLRVRLEDLLSLYDPALHATKRKSAEKGTPGARTGSRTPQTSGRREAE